VGFRAEPGGSGRSRAEHFLTEPLFFRQTFLFYFKGLFFFGLFFLARRPGQSAVGTKVEPRGETKILNKEAIQQQITDRPSTTPRGVFFPSKPPYGTP